MQVWTEYRTREELGETYRKYCQDIHPDRTWFKRWRKLLEHPDDRSYALQMLKEHPDPERVKKCYDGYLTTEQWDKIFTIYGGHLQWSGPRGRWNQITDPHLCKEIRHLNIFTRDCNDIPDWRTDEERAIHEEFRALEDAAYEEETRKSAEE